MQAELADHRWLHYTNMALDEADRRNAYVRRALLNDPTGEKRDALQRLRGVELGNPED